MTDFRWRPISELTEGHKDGRYLVFSRECELRGFYNSPFSPAVCWRFQEETKWNKAWEGWAKSQSSSQYKKMTGHKYFCELPMTSRKEKEQYNDQERFLKELDKFTGNKSLLKKIGAYYEEEDMFYLSSRAENSLRDNGVAYVNQLIKLTERDLKLMHGIGESSILHIKDELRIHGLKLKD